MLRCATDPQSNFSDDWADPGHNNAPSAWPRDLQSLQSTLRNYVRDTLVAFRNNGIDLAIVSLGNEIRNGKPEKKLHRISKFNVILGMLWPLGRADPWISNTQQRTDNFRNLANLYKSARLGVDDAVRQGVSKPIVMIHIDNGW